MRMQVEYRRGPKESKRWGIKGVMVICFRRITPSCRAAPQTTASVTISKADQTITGFAPVTPIAYSTGGTFTLNATGGASGNAIIFASTTPAICSLAGNTASILAVGTCTITADQTGSINYNAANQVTANVTINKIDQTITGFAPATPIAYSIGGSFMLTATGGASANPVTYVSSSPLVCSVGNGVASILSVGTCTLTANQAGNATFNAAVQVTVNVIINKADQTIP